MPVTVLRAIALGYTASGGITHEGSTTNVDRHRGIVVLNAVESRDNGKLIAQGSLTFTYRIGSQEMLRTAAGADETDGRVQGRTAQSGGCERVLDV